MKKVQENCLTIFLPKEVDHHNAEEVKKSADTIIEKEHIKYVIFDFEQTDFMDSSGIGMIMGRKRILSYSKGTVAAIHVNDRVLKIMQLSGIYKHIEISQEPVWNYRVR